MNEELGESLSALMDGEAGEADIQRVLDSVKDPALREAWRRYHAARGSLQADAGAANLDLSARIMAAIDEEPALGGALTPATSHREPRAADMFVETAGGLSAELGESLSALIDDEATDIDIQRVLDSTGEPTLRESWRRHHIARGSLQANAGVVDLDVSARIMAAVHEEPSFDMVPSPAANEVEPGAAAATIKPVASFQHILRPVASFAVAASVTAAVLLGSQYYGFLGIGSEARIAPNAVAERSSPVTLLGGTATQAGYGYATPAQPAIEPAPAATDYDALARERLRRYMLPHAGEAALNAPQGMMPYAKVATFETEE